MELFSAYGLRFSSSFSFADPQPGGVGDEIVLRRGPIGPCPMRLSHSGNLYGRSRSGIQLRRPGVAAFEVRGGREIVVDPEPAGDDGLLRLLILGPVLALLLEERGRLVLHASAVDLGGGAAAFLGSAGAGKSTAALALHLRGRPAVADDVTVVDAGGDAVLVYPGIPHFKCWPESAGGLGLDARSLPRLHPLVEKRTLAAHGSFAGAPLDLRCIYLLEEGREPAIEPLAPQGALVELLRHSFFARWEVPENSRRRFRLCAALAGRIPVRILRRPLSFAVMDRWMEMVEADFAKSS